MGTPQASQPALASSSKVLLQSGNFPSKRDPQKTIPKNPLPEVPPKTLKKNEKN